MDDHASYGASGNDAYRVGQFDNAVGHYSNAIQAATESAAPEVVAKYYGNRAQVRESDSVVFLPTKVLTIQ
jgi:hypothetical protein